MARPRDNWGPFGRNLPEDLLGVVNQGLGMRPGAGEGLDLLHGREENQSIHDELGVRKYYQEWSRRMGRDAQDRLRRSWAKAGRASAAVTSLVVHHTVLDVGDAHVDARATSVFVVGRYLDSFRLEQGRWLLTDRTVRLETRQLGIGTHLIV